MGRGGVRGRWYERERPPPPYISLSLSLSLSQVVWIALPVVTGVFLVVARRRVGRSVGRRRTRGGAARARAV